MSFDAGETPLRAGTSKKVLAELQALGMVAPLKELGAVGIFNA